MNRILEISNINKNYFRWSFGSLVIFTLLLILASQVSAQSGYPEVNTGRRHVHNEYYYNESSGLLEPVDYNKTAVKMFDNYEKDMSFTGGPGNRFSYRDSGPFVIWNGEKWVTRNDINRTEGRYEGSYARLTRFDDTFVTFSGAYTSELIGTQTVYEYKTVTTTIRGRRRVTKMAVPLSVRRLTGTWYDLTGVPLRFTPVTEIFLTGSAKVVYESDYHSPFNLAKFTKPGEVFTTVYGNTGNINLHRFQEELLLGVGEVAVLLPGYTAMLSFRKLTNEDIILHKMKIYGPEETVVTCIDENRALVKDRN